MMNKKKQANTNNEGEDPSSFVFRASLLGASANKNNNNNSKRPSQVLNGSINNKQNNVGLMFASTNLNKNNIFGGATKSAKTNKATVARRNMFEKSLKETEKTEKEFNNLFPDWPAHVGGDVQQQQQNPSSSATPNKNNNNNQKKKVGLGGKKK